MPDKVVVDTNVLLSALLFGGTPLEAINSILDAGLEWCFSEELIIEVIRKLRTKFAADDDTILFFKQWVGQESVYNVKRTVVFDPDPADAYLLALCETCGASWLITGDKKHLLPIHKWKQTRILSPAEFVAVNKQE